MLTLQSLWTWVACLNYQGPMWLASQTPKKTKSGVMMCPIHSPVSPSIPTLRFQLDANQNHVTTQKDSLIIQFIKSKQKISDLVSPIASIHKLQRASPHIGELELSGPGLLRSISPPPPNLQTRERERERERERAQIKCKIKYSWDKTNINSATIYVITSFMAQTRLFVTTFCLPIKKAYQVEDYTIIYTTQVLQLPEYNSQCQVCHPDLVLELVPLQTYHLPSVQNPL